MPPSTVERVAAIVARVGRVGPQERVNESTLLVGGGIALDSVCLLELRLAVEQEFGMEVDAEEVLRAKALHTVGALAAFIDAKAEHA
jgi:acyl carrier protein